MLRCMGEVGRYGVALNSWYQRSPSPDLEVLPRRSEPALPDDAKEMGQRQRNKVRATHSVHIQNLEGDSRETTESRQEKQQK